MRISDWSSDVCSSDLAPPRVLHDLARRVEPHRLRVEQRAGKRSGFVALEPAAGIDQLGERRGVALRETVRTETLDRSEEHTSELQSLMRISYAVFCLKQNSNTTHM